MGKQPVKIKKRDNVYEVKSGMTLGSALTKLEILPETVLATRNGELIVEDEIIQEGETIILIDVISGG
ncbi:MoaD/ThiS family protein [Chloroflexota bacterium]